MNSELYHPDPQLPVAKTPKLFTNVTDDKYKNFHALVFVFGFCIGVLIPQFAWVTNFRLRSSTYYVQGPSDAEADAGIAGIDCHIIGDAYFSKESSDSDDSSSDTNFEDYQMKEGHTRILCWVKILASDQYNESLAVRKTWGKRCDEMLFFATADQKRKLTAVNNELKIIYMDKKHLKTQWNIDVQIWKFIRRRHLNKFEWFIKVELDSYILIENLRYYLKNFNPNQPFYLGYSQHNSEAGICATEKPGYVFSKKAVGHFLNAVYHNCAETSKSVRTLWQIVYNSGEKKLMNCIKEARLLILRPRDSLNRPLFIPSQLEPAILGSGSNTDSALEMDTGFNCCSDLLIGFLTTSFKETYTIHYIISQLHPFGINKHDDFKATPNMNNPNLFPELHHGYVE